MERYSGYIEQKIQDQKYMGQIASIVAAQCSQLIKQNKKPFLPKEIIPWAWDVEETPERTKEELKEEHERVKKLLNAK